MSISSQQIKNSHKDDYTIEDNINKAQWAPPPLSASISQDKQQVYSQGYQPPTNLIPSSYGAAFVENNINNTNSNYITTIDEPVLATIMRDLRSIGRKTLLVAFPCATSCLFKEDNNNKNVLRDWDLWGPLLFCLILAIILGLSAAKNGQEGLVFSAIFVIVWVGSAVVTLNAKFVGAKVSFFQTLCLLGYCMAPLCLGAVILALFSHAFSVNYWIFRLVLMIILWGWSTFAALRFFKGSACFVKPDREMLVVYPVMLLFFFISWMVYVGA